MDVQMAELGRLLEKARRLAASAPDAQQVIVVKTAKSKEYGFANRCVGSAQDEEGFLDMLRAQDDTQIRYLVCMWHSGQIDVPSIRFRRRLISVCPQNRNALLVLQGGHAFSAKELEGTMPEG